MQIVSQFAVFSYCALPCQPMLPAPPVYPMLAAPKIAGLLPARIPAASPKVVSGEILFDTPDDDLAELERQLGPFLSIEEADAEIAELLAAVSEAWTWPRGRSRSSRGEIQ